MPSIPEKLGPWNFWLHVQYQLILAIISTLSGCYHLLLIGRVIAFVVEATSVSMDYMKMSMKRFVIYPESRALSALSLSTEDQF